MEEVLNFTKQACELARKLELELPNMATNNPDMLFSSIDDVEKAFDVAKEKVRMMLSQQDITTTTTTPMLLSHDVFMQKAQEGQMGGSATPMQDLMRGGIHAQTMDQLLLMQHPFDVSVFLENKMLSSKGSLRIGEMDGREVEGLERSKGLEGEMQGIEASPSRPRKSRKNDLEKRTVMRPAPQVGNTEVPPEDGFTWRKYGQKEILGRKYPRGYYRCTHQKLYSCPAKKQVQRLDENPNIVEVTYRGIHTCHMSSTAPSSFPPQLLVVDTQTTISPQLSPSSTSIPGWLSSANLGLGGGGGGGGSGGGPSTSKFDIDYPVADMADAMFNSGSSSGNSMEYLFAPNEDKWEAGEKKS